MSDPIDSLTFLQDARNPRPTARGRKALFLDSDGKLKLICTQGVITEIGAAGPRGQKGDKGDPGVGIQGPEGPPGTGTPGDAATITVGSVATGAPGTPVSVVNSGTSSAAVFDFEIPEGDPGLDGSNGTDGTAATVSVGTVTTGAPGSSAAVTNSGSSSAATFNFTIPRGDVGATGSSGATGAAGAAATIAVGTVTGLAAGATPTVTNTGSSSAATFDFGIPAGATGATGSTGATGPAGAVNVKSTTKTDVFTTTSTTFVNITGLSVAITPASASNKILVRATVVMSGTTGGYASGIRLTRDGTAIGIGDAAGTRTRSGSMQQFANNYEASTIALEFMDSPATTSAVTYAVQTIVQSGGTCYINERGDDSDLARMFRGISTITVMECTP